MINSLRYGQILGRLRSPFFYLYCCWCRFERVRGVESGRRLDVDAVGLLDFFHHESAFHRVEALDVAQHVEQELLVGFHIGGIDLEQIVEMARNVVALSHFGYLEHHRGESRG